MHISLEKMAFALKLISIYIDNHSLLNKMSNYSYFFIETTYITWNYLTNVGLARPTLLMKKVYFPYDRSLSFLTFIQRLNIIDRIRFFKVTDGYMTLFVPEMDSASQG